MSPVPDKPSLHFNPIRKVVLSLPTNFTLLGTERANSLLVQATLRAVRGRATPMDIVRVEQADSRPRYSFLSVGWGILSGGSKFNINFRLFATFQILTLSQRD